MSTSKDTALYRCAECGHGGKLIAWAEGLFEGPLGADGLLTSYDWFEDTAVCESSIKCDEHGDCVTIHKRVNGQWCVWTTCPHCRFGETQDRWGAWTLTCHHCHGTGGSWAPVEEAVKA